MDVSARHHGQLSWLGDDCYRSTLLQHSFGTCKLLLCVPDANSTNPLGKARRVLSIASEERKLRIGEIVFHHQFEFSLFRSEPIVKHKFTRHSDEILRGVSRKSTTCTVCRTHSAINIRLQTAPVCRRPILGQSSQPQSLPCSNYAACP